MLTPHLAFEIYGFCFEKGLVIEISGDEDQVIKVLAPRTTLVETLRTGLSILREATSDVMTSGTKIAAE